MSPFFTERARTRAPIVLEYAASAGTALLVSPRGEVVMTSGGLVDVDENRLARACVARGAARRATSFGASGACVHAVPVRDGWILCVVSAASLSPIVIGDRARRAAHVLALALVDIAVPDGSGSAPPTGAPAEARIDGP